MAEQIKEPAARPDSVSAVPDPGGRRRDLTPSSCLLTSHLCGGTHMLAHIDSK